MADIDKMDFRDIEDIDHDFDYDPDETTNAQFNTTTGDLRNEATRETETLTETEGTETNEATDSPETTFERATETARETEGMEANKGRNRATTREVDDTKTEVVCGKSKKVKRRVRKVKLNPCLLYTSPSPRDKRQSRMPSSA